MGRTRKNTNTFKTNQIFKDVLAKSKFSQARFGDEVGREQPTIWAYIHNKFEINFSEFERYMAVFGLEYDIVLKERNDKLDSFDFDVYLEKMNVKLVHEFSKETDYEKKYSLDKKIQAIKTILKNK